MRGENNECKWTATGWTRRKDESTSTTMDSTSSPIVDSTGSASSVPAMPDLSKEIAESDGTPKDITPPRKYLGGPVRKKQNAYTRDGLPKRSMVAQIMYPDDTKKDAGFKAVDFITHNAELQICRICWRKSNAAKRSYFQSILAMRKKS